jgi:hypothetical protein
MDDLEKLLPGLGSHKAEVTKDLNEMAEMGLIEKVEGGYRNGAWPADSLADASGGCLASERRGHRSCP